MYGNNNFQPRISVDKFGNPYQVVGLKDKKGTGFGKGYVKLGNQLYKLEYSDSKKDGVLGWIKVTKVRRNASAGSM